MPFNEVVGKAPKLEPEHRSATAAKVGVTSGFTVIVSVAVVAHCPVVGVKVYSVVAVFDTAGDQVPVMPFNEVVGKAPKLAPEHMPGTCRNVGTA